MILPEILTNQGGGGIMENKLSDIYQALIGDSIIYGIDGSSGPNVDYKNPIQHTMNQGTVSDAFLFKETIATVNGLCIIHYQAPKAATNNIYWYVSVNGLVVYLLPLSRAGAYYSSFPVKNGDTIRLVYPSSIGINEATSSIVVCPYLNDTYSEEEKVIGTWIDGKPIYRRVWENVAYNTDGSLVNDINIGSDIDKVTKLERLRYLKSGDTNYYYNGSDRGNIYIEMPYIKANIAQGGGNMVAGTYTIILEYTKTTD